MPADTFYCIGSLNFDYYEERGQVGGAACNTAFFLTKLFSLSKDQIPISLMGVVGTDENAQKIIQKLKMDSIDIGLVGKIKGDTGSTHITLDKNNERTIARNISVTSSLPRYIKEPHIQNLLKGKKAYIKGSIDILDAFFKNQPADHELFACDISGLLKEKDNQRFHFKNSIKILFGNDEEFENLLEKLISIPRKEEKKLRELDIAQQNELLFKIIDIFDAEILCLKLGEKGARVITNKQIYVYETPKVDVIDTTGAGDAFNAGFIWSILRNKPIGVALKNACELGTLNTTFFGGQNPIIFPKIQEIFFA